MEQIWQEKERCKREDSNREKHREDGFSSVIAIEDGFHDIAFLKQ